MSKFTTELLEMAAGTEVEARIEEGVQKCGAVEGFDVSTSIVLELRDVM